AADRGVVEIDQVLLTPDLVVFARVRTPAGPDRDVALGRGPVGARPVAAVQAGGVGPARNEVGAVGRGPTGLARGAALVADPAHVGAGVAEDDRVRLKLADQRERRRPVVVALAVDPARFARPAVEAVAAVGAVQEDLADLAIAREQLAKLIAEVGDVLGPAIVGAVAVPRREVDAEAKSAPAAGVRELLHHVAAPRAPGAVLHGVLGELRRPQPEAVVMFGGQDQALHAAFLRGAHDLIGVEVAGV